MLENETLEPVFDFPPSWNRSKYLFLSTVRDLWKAGQPTDILTVYVNSSIPARTILCRLNKWVAWRYIMPLPGYDPPRYKLTPKGLRLLSALEEHRPWLVQEWLNQQADWCNRLATEDIKDWHRSALIRRLEPLRTHRPGTPRPRVKQSSC